MELGEQEAAAVAKVGVVRAELVAVVAQGQGLLEAAGQRGEAGEMSDPFGVGQRVQADAGGPGLVAVAQDGFGEVGRGDGVEEFRAEVGMGE